MRLIVSRIVVAVLLPAFLLACTSIAFGFSWCIGGDGHVEIGSVADNICDDDGLITRGVANHKYPAIQNPSDDHCGPCLDLSIQNSAYTAKHLKEITSPPSEAIILNVFLGTSIQNVKLIAGNLASQPPPRISQTILAHRTIVLLI